MKWWYVLVLIVGVFLGGWIWGKYGEKRATKVTIIEGSKIEGEISNETTMIISNKDGKKVEVVQVVGRVSSWDYENGILEFSLCSRRCYHPRSEAKWDLTERVSLTDRSPL